jgi:hypothetical protein
LEYKELILGIYFFIICLAEGCSAPADGCSGLLAVMIQEQE